MKRNLQYNAPGGGPRSADQAHNLLRSAEMIRRLIAGSLLTIGLSVAPATAQTFDVLHKFDGTGGAGGWGALVEGADGNFYGTGARKSPRRPAQGPAEALRRDRSAGGRAGE